jgi:uncharacterized OB-fold protein
MKTYIDFSNSPLPDVEFPEWATFWEGTRKGEIRLPKCRDCHQFHWYLSFLCPFCQSPNIEWQAITSQPRLFSWTCVRQDLTQVFTIRGPYIVAMVEFDEAPHLYFTSNLVDCPPEDVHIGMPLEAVFQKVDDKITMPLFKPMKTKETTTS